jgi:hypothetical protein
MRSRSLLCLFVLLLVAASLANAAEPVAPTTPASETASAAAKPSCPTDDLSFLTPAPTEMASTVCGSCSVTSCQGKNVNGVCRVDVSGQIYTCLAFGTCSDGVTRQCGCYRYIP